MATAVTGEFNVLGYGADPTGAVSSSAAFQAAFNAAIAVSGKAVIPAPAIGGFYRLDKTMFIAPLAGGRACTVSIEGPGRGGDPPLRWYGPADTSMFFCSGMYYCRFKDVCAWNISNAPDLVFWDVRPTYLAHGCTGVKWDNCLCQCGNPGGRNIGWRVGQTDPSALYQDNNHFHWSDCTVKSASGLYGAAPQYGDIGWQLGGWNTQPTLFENCGVSRCLRYLAGGMNTMVPAGNRVQPTDTSFPVVSTLRFKPSGLLLLPNNEIASYSDLTPSSFTGLTRGLNGTQPVLFGAGNVVEQYYTDTALYTSTTSPVAATNMPINVVSTAGFQTTGNLMMVPASGPAEIISYTGTTPTSFTGCIGGVLGSKPNFYGTGALVFEYANGPSMGALSPSGPMTWIGGGSGGEDLAFFFPGAARYTIIGDRCENPNRYMQCGAGSSSAHSIITLLGCEIADGGPADGTLFTIYSAPILEIQSCDFSCVNIPAYTSSMIVVHSSADEGSISMSGGTVQGKGPFHSFTSKGGWPVSYQRILQKDSQGRGLGFYSSQP